MSQKSCARSWESLKFSLCWCQMTFPTPTWIIHNSIRLKQVHKCWYVKVRVLVKNFRSFDLAWLHLTALSTGLLWNAWIVYTDYHNPLLHFSQFFFLWVWEYMNIWSSQWRRPFHLYRPLVLGSVSSSSWKCSKNSSKLLALLSSMKTKLKEEIQA